ncbi:MAG: methyl-accepting chemotaxis protein, partial [Planctomycetota bacterium]|nr:methyl-accepting chemotaxis protein [Planctomycetota bacterium]
LIVIFLAAKIIPLVLLAVIAWRQFVILGNTLREIAVNDSTNSLNGRATQNIERLSTDTARQVADFLYKRDDDILRMARMEPTEENYRIFVNNARSRVIKQGEWELAADGSSWVNAKKASPFPAGVSTNGENNNMDAFHAIPGETFEYENIPLYDEITFVSLDGMELIKVTAADSPKRRFPMDSALKDVSKRENTYVKAETYFPQLRNLTPGEIYVSDVIGAYVGSNFIGMYAPDTVAQAAKDRGYDIEYAPEEQAYAGRENPLGRRFEGIVRWAAPVTGAEGAIIGFVTLALNHDHIMEFVDHITPMDERYTEMPSAFEGNYAFIWDYKCRSICHPRHHSIVGFDPDTGDPQIPWLESSIYEDWKQSGVPKWMDYVKDYPIFYEQSRGKKPAMELTKAGLVGLDGRYLNNAPQCTGWMDLTGTGGSGSFYILWSGLYKLNTAAAIPYYTGQYAPSAANGHSRRGFGFVAIGAGLDYFTLPAKTTEEKLSLSIQNNLRETLVQLIVTTMILCAVVMFIAVWMAWHISTPIIAMARDMSRLAIGDIVERGVPPVYLNRYDEIGGLAQSLQALMVSRRDEIELANSLAKGDYTRSITLRSDSDMLGRALNAMIQINKNSMYLVYEAVSHVGQGVNIVSEASQSLLKGVETSENVSNMISDAASTVDRQARDNAGRARDANQLVAASRDSARRGYEAVVELASAMAEIQQAGKKIASVAKLIDDIAFQTNLLALNAAVEASRAGRHGKGFSVVADEVRSLSARSARAAHETGDMVASMLTSMESGSKLAKRSDLEFHEIVESTSKVVEIFKSIADASEDQSSSMTQIVKNLGQIKDVIQENSLNARQTATSAETLHREAVELHRMVSRFRLGAHSEDGNPDGGNAHPAL